MSSRAHSTNLAALFWVLLMGVALYYRPTLPVDETRYLAVAWEMWLRGDFLVPYLNGETYSHKPPMLFWLIHAGWGVFGVNDWSPRLIAPLFGLGCLFLTRSLGLALWPTDNKAADLAPLILTGCVFWTLFVTLTMFDMMLAFFCLLGLLGIVKARRQGGWIGGVLVILAVGLGILTKGPAILLHILPVALTAPLWGRLMAPLENTNPSTGFGWYFGLMIAVALGIAMALVWAIPAGQAGGEAYQEAIFWGQAAGRMVESFAHQRPIWWYAALIPGLLLPWMIWPSLWNAIRDFGAGLWRDGGSLLCVIWGATAFIAFSLISGKQLHYLLPEFPALALIAARCLSQRESQQTASRWSQFPSALVFVALGAALVLLPLGRLPVRLPIWASEVSGNWGGLIILAAVLALLYLPKRSEKQVMSLVLLPVSLVVALHLAVSPMLAKRYDLKPISLQLKAWEDEGIAIANFGKYHGQFQFLGRLTRPVAVVGQRENDLENFLRDHPTGRIVAYYDKVPDRARPVAVFPFRQSVMVIWDAATMIAHPGIGNRS